MELDRTSKIFLITGALIFTLGFLLQSKEIGDSIGTVIMISGASLIIGTLVNIVMKWTGLNF